MHDPDHLLAVAQRAARAGAEQLLSWRTRFSAREKGPRDLVTDADLASQQAVLAVLQEAFPEHAFVGEEGAATGQADSAWRWYVDPLDGTVNYVHDVPFYAVSVAVACQGRLVAGVVVDPLRDECFAAAAGRGATLNGSSIQVSRTAALEASLVAVSFPPLMTPETVDFQRFVQVAPQCQAIRRTGSAALNLAYVACGRFDAHWAKAIHSWDAAAGVLLVAEAGGTVSACDGTPFLVERGDYLTAGSGELHRRLLDLFTDEPPAAATRNPPSEPR